MIDNFTVDDETQEELIELSVSDLDAETNKKQKRKNAVMADKKPALDDHSFNRINRGTKVSGLLSGKKVNSS